jgi:hypothetical protein
MTGTTVSVTLGARHPSAATIPCPVFINERRGRGWTGTVEQHTLFVPPPPVWTVDHARAVIAALRRFLPVHDMSTATGRVFLEGRGSGRTANFEVRARGWAAQCEVAPFDRERVDDPPTALGRVFTDPMIAVLRDLEKASPFSVASIREVAADISTPPLPQLGPQEQQILAALRQILQKVPRERKAALVQWIQHTVVRASQDDDDND